MKRAVIINESEISIQSTDGLHPRFIDLTGERYGDLLVIGFAGFTQRRKASFYARCDCGNTIWIRSGNLRRENGTKSCGCLIEKRNHKHGYGTRKNRNPIYRSWKHIKDWCYNPNDKAYKNVGGKGIRLYDEWVNDSKAFVEWVIDNLGKRPSKLHKLGRINKKGDFEPRNLIWSDNITQAVTRTNTHNHAAHGRVTPTYTSWNNMCRKYKDYVCSRWLKAKGGSFENFLQDMGIKPEGSRLRRIDVKEKYSPENCYWA